MSFAGVASFVALQRHDFEAMPDGIEAREAGPMRDDGLVLERVAHALWQRDESQARELLRQLPKDDPVGLPQATLKLRPVVPSSTNEREVRLTDKRVRARRYSYYGWRCAYCDRRLVVSGVIELIGNLCPDVFPFPSHHMPARLTHPAAIRVYPNLDHFVPKAKKGRDVESNLVAACTPCNEWLTDRNERPDRHMPQRDWDGLASCYRSLLSLAKSRVDPIFFASRSRLQDEWMAALGV